MLLEGSTDSALRIGAIVLLALVGGTCKLGFVALLKRSLRNKVPIPRLCWYFLLGFLLVIGGLCQFSRFLFGEAGNKVWVIRDEAGTPVVSEYRLYGKARFALSTEGNVDLEERSEPGRKSNYFLNDTAGPLVYKDSEYRRSSEILLPAKGVTWAYEPSMKRTILLSKSSGGDAPKPDP